MLPPGQHSSLTSNLGTGGASVVGSRANVFTDDVSLMTQVMGATFILTPSMKRLKTLSFMKKVSFR